MRLSKLPPPASLCPEGKAVWGPLTKLLASRGFDNAVFAMAVEVLVGAIVIDAAVYRELQGRGFNPYSEPVWREVREHLRNMAAECALTLEDLRPFLGEHTSEHHRKAWELREELREIEREIAGSLPESDAWVEALKRQQWNHFYLIGADLLARVHDDREAESKRMADEDFEGEEWKGSGE